MAELATEEWSPEMKRAFAAARRALDPVGVEEPVPPHRGMPEWMRSMLPWLAGTVLTILVAIAGDLIRLGIFQRDFQKMQEHSIVIDADLKSLHQESVDNQKAIRDVLEHDNAALSSLRLSLPQEYVPRAEHVEKDRIQTQLEDTRDKQLQQLTQDMNTLLRRK